MTTTGSNAGKHRNATDIGIQPRRIGGGWQNDASCGIVAERQVACRIGRGRPGAGTLTLVPIAVVSAVMFGSVVAGPQDRKPGTPGVAGARATQTKSDQNAAASQQRTAPPRKAGAPDRQRGDEGEKRPDAPKKSSGKPVDAAVPRIEITPAREAAALAFARQYHPDLARLLQTLQKIDRQQYLKAVRELYRQSERLARMKDRGDWRYDLALQTWIVDSRLQVLIARYAMSEDERLLPQIRELIRERRLLERELLVRERERLEMRLKKLQEAIEQIDAGMEQSVEDELNRLVRKAQAAAVSNRARSNKRNGAAAGAGGKPQGSGGSGQRPGIRRTPPSSGGAPAGKAREQ